MHFTLQFFDDSIFIFWAKQRISRSGKRTGKSHMTPYFWQVALYVNPRCIFLSRNSERYFWNTNRHVLKEKRTKYSISLWYENVTIGFYCLYNIGFIIINFIHRLEKLKNKDKINKGIFWRISSFEDKLRMDAFNHWKWYQPPVAYWYLSSIE